MFSKPIEIAIQTNRAHTVKVAVSVIIVKYSPSVIKKAYELSVDIFRII